MLIFRDPCSNTSIHYHKYFFTIVDDHTRLLWIFLMSSIVEIQSLLQGFVNSVERQLDTKAKTILLDNAVKFITSHFFNLLILYIKSLALKPLNRMILLKGSINIYLTWLKLSYFSLTFPTFFGFVL